MSGPGPEVVHKPTQTPDKPKVDATDAGKKKSPVANLDPNATDALAEMNEVLDSLSRNRADFTRAIKSSSFQVAASAALRLKTALRTLQYRSADLRDLETKEANALLEEAEHQRSLTVSALDAGRDAACVAGVEAIGAIIPALAGALSVAGAPIEAASLPRVQPPRAGTPKADGKQAEVAKVMEPGVAKSPSEPRSKPTPILTFRASALRENKNGGGMAGKYFINLTVLDRGATVKQADGSQFDRQPITDLRGDDLAHNESSIFTQLRSRIGSSMDAAAVEKLAADVAIDVNTKVRGLAPASKGTNNLWRDR